jgi:hypothetical protein
MGNLEYDPAWRQSITEALAELREGQKEMSKTLVAMQLSTATIVKQDALEKALDDERNMRREGIQSLRDEVIKAKASIITLKWVAGLASGLFAVSWPVFIFLSKRI